MTITSPRPTGREEPRRPAKDTRAGLLAATMAGLAAAVAATSLVGPLVLDLMRYRTSPTTLNQLLGSDAAALFVVAPVGVLAALLVRRGHPAGALLASGVGGFALYTYAQ
jgi:hypothetical protein